MFKLTKAECEELATKVYNNQISGGKYQDFRYTKISKDDSLTLVGFVDIKERLDSFNKFLLLSSTISLGAYLALIAFFNDGIALHSNSIVSKDGKLVVFVGDKETGKSTLSAISFHNGFDFFAVFRFFLAFLL